MRILIISKAHEGGLAQSYLRAFLELKTEAKIIDDEKIYRESSFFARNRYSHRLFWRFLAIPLQKKLLSEIVVEKPDLVLILKGWLIKPNTILEIKKLLPQTLVFNYNPDNPFNAWHHGNSNSWIKKSIPLYDCYFIWGKFLIEPFMAAGAKKVEYLPFGYDPKLCHLVKINEKEKNFYGSDVVFVGTWDKEREEWLNYLTDYNLKIWGSGWGKVPRLKKNWQGRAVRGEEFSMVYSAPKININILRKQNIPAHNMRTFEVPACGGFMLSTRTEEQKEFFED